MQPDISKSFGDDFRSKYEAYLGIVESGTSPSPRLVVADYGTLPSVLEDLAAAVQLAGMPKGLPREHEEALFGKYLPAIFAALLKRKLVSHVLLRARFKDDIVKATIALFCCWMAARLPTLGQKSLTDARTLDSIFRFKSRFFDLNGLDILVTDLEGVVAGRFKMPGGLTAYVTHDYQNVRSKVVRFLVDCFGKLGGFEFVHSAIADSEPKAEELAPMTRWLKAVGSMAEYLNKEVANEVCVPVCLAAKEYLGRMKEAELPLVKIVELKKFIKHVKKICRFCKQERVQDIVGDLELTVATQFLAVFSTEKRVAAIDLILQRVRALKDRFPPKHVLEKEKKDNEGYRLAKWLEQRKLVETLFAGAMQADVIKKMAPVLELMYSWRCLAIDAVLMIWGQAAEAGTGLQTAMFQALEGVLTRLSERDAKIFFEIFRGFPADKYTEEAAKILSALLKNEYSRGKAGTADRSHPTTEAANDPEPGFILSSEETVPSPLKPDEVLEFVWGLAQSKEYSRLGMPIQTAIVESLVTTLQECYRGKLAKYARRCEENIVKSSGFVPCSRIFQRLATSLVEKPAVSHFFERVTLGLLGFKKSAAELAAPKISGCASKSQPGTENGGDNPMELGEEDHKCCASPAREHIYESLAINGFPYYSELEERLELLGFMLRTYKQDLPGTYIDMLWKVFLTNSFSEKEATIFFRFMKKLICTSRGVEFIAAGLFDTFTFDVLLKLAEADYSETALDCLVNILIPMNAHYGHIKILKDDKVELADTKLIGIGGLWGVAFRAGSHDVRHKAADRLVDLYTHLAAELTGAERLGVAKDFVAKCMHELQAEKDKENECAQVLALEMLEKYMKSREEDSAHQPPPPPKDFCLSIKYWTDTVQIKVNENTRVSEALQMGFLALKMTKQIESLRYVSDGREIYPTDDPLSIYGIFGPTLIEIKEDYQMYNLLSVPLLNNRDSVPMNDDTASAASLEQLKSMFSDLPARLVEAALKRANGDLERAVECLTNPAESQALLSELGITEDLTKRKPSEAPQGTKLDLICGPGYSHFSALYGLLGSDNPTVASKAWELVSALRVNDDFFHRVQAFRTAEDYETTLKSASPHQLAYILRAIEKALRSPEDRWLASWATSGGFRLLWGRAEGFLGKEEGGRSDIVLRCVEAVLRIAREAVEFMVEVRRPEIYKEYVAMKKGFNKNCCQDAALKSVKEVVTEEFVKRLKPTEMFGTISRVMSSFLESEMSFASALHQGLHLLHLLPYLDPACEAQIWTGSAAYPELVAAILLRAQNEAVQDQLVFELQTMLSLLCKVAKHPDTRIDCLSLLLRLLRDSAGDLGPHFFSLLDGLLDVYSGTPCCCANTVDTTLAHRIPLSKPDLVTLLIHRIGSSSSPQPGLGGHIRILAKFVRSEEKTVSLLSEPEAAAVTECLLGEIFGPRVCESKEILDYAIPLLSMIVKAAPGIFPRVSRAVVGFNAKHSSAASGTGETAKTNAARAVNGYVGLENFGCTCYINSLFQQLYMMPRFRDKILNLNVTELEKAKDGDRVTLNLRAIFAALQSSERQYYAPKEFCDSFRFRHGKVIDTHVQEDVDEFFTHLASRLEDELKSAGLPQAANEELGMVLQSRISSLEKGLHYVSVTESPQLALPLNIKGSKSVQECLDAFFKEEILDGDNKYYCEDYKKQIKVSKRCAIKSLSNTVVISLKRFDCTLTKLNDYCEFPDRLNFFRWSSDGQGLHPDSPAAGNYDYQLVGVLIHSGTALTGHYFSYIKERATTSPNCGVWFEFNDTMVKPCEYGQVVSQAFGGPSHGGNCTSAYLLFYEKLEGAEDKSSAAVTKPRFARLPIDDPQVGRKIVYFRAVCNHVSTFHRNTESSCCHVWNISQGPNPRPRSQLSPKRVPWHHARLYQFVLQCSASFVNSQRNPIPVCRNSWPHRSSTARRASRSRCRSWSTSRGGTRRRCSSSLWHTMRRKCGRGPDS